MNIRRLINIILAIVGLTMTTACYNYDRDVVDEVTTGDCYINLAISVSNGNHSTRAGELPASGENGNGREAGFERENNVTGITLILYRTVDPMDGINVDTGSEDPVLELVRYFPVTLGNRDAQGTTYTSKTEEAYYTTGDQPLGKPNLNLSGSYHAIVIANASEVAASLIEGTSTLSDIRDVVLNTTYVGDPTKSADACINFIMSSEEDNTISFASATKTIDSEGDKHFDFSSQPIVIERMAARIDFWSKGATYDDTYPTAGYVYRPWKTGDTTEPSSSDRFVLTSITPFNLNNGSEYLLKRTNDTDKYLADESGTNYVIDPATASKTGTSTPSTFVNALSGIASLTDFSSNAYCHTIAAMHAQVGTGKTGGFSYTEGSTTAEDVIICYPMENTLPDESPLYYYATGIVIEGDYYIDNDKTDASKCEHRIYFGYIRHQGESDEAYDALLPSELDTEVKTSSSRPMNFGIVRNNIYRISIDKVIEKTPTGPKIKIKIEEEKWRHVDNPTIYI
jgi:hypothetical protein